MHRNHTSFLFLCLLVYVTFNFTLTSTTDIDLGQLLMFTLPAASALWAWSVPWRGIGAPATLALGLIKLVQELVYFSLILLCVLTLTRPPTSFSLLLPSQYLLDHISSCFLKYSVLWGSLSALSLTSPVFTSLVLILPWLAEVIRLRYQPDHVTSLIKTPCFHWDKVQIP